jgi:hypothetical protein
LNSSCIDADYLVPPADGQIYVALPTFYYAKIEVDLRHLDSNATLANVSLFLSINNTDTGANYTERIPLNISTGSFSLFADNNLIINAYFSIEDADENAAISKSYLFSQSVSITIVKANPQGSFLFVVTNQDVPQPPSVAHQPALQHDQRCQRQQLRRLLPLPTQHDVLDLQSAELRAVLQ